MPTTISTPNAPAAVGPYSQAVSTGDDAGAQVFISGQIPLVPATGQLVEGDIQAQARQSLTNIGEILKAAGLSFADVVKTTVLLADINDFVAVNEVYPLIGKLLPDQRTFGVAEFLDAVATARKNSTVRSTNVYRTTFMSKVPKSARQLKVKQPRLKLSQHGPASKPNLQPGRLPAKPSRHCPNT